MERYDEGYLRNTEEKVDRIREKALQLVRVIHPEIECVIDRRTLDDYCEKIWDYPGQWYVSFKLPKGFDSEEKLIRTIADETIRYFCERK